MAKSGKGRRKKPSWRLPTAEEILQQQIEAFREKFGRDPLPGEPIFFDPDMDEPRPMPEKLLEDAAVEFLKGAPPWIISARWLESFKEFPVRQKPASFNLDSVMETMEGASRGAN